jgi:hypothetical protein
MRNVLKFVCGSVWLQYLVSDIKEHGLWVFEGEVMKRIFEPKRGEVIGRWRKLNNGELQNLCYSPSIIRMIR